MITAIVGVQSDVDQGCLAGRRSNYTLARQMHGGIEMYQDCSARLNWAQSGEFRAVAADLTPFRPKDYH